MKHMRNQNGAATIMFTMFMVIIISLLAVGFATLVRNDQRAALDKTLSNQAQYAAESAINKVASLIQDKTITADSSGNCSGQVGATSYKATFGAGSGITVSCLDWKLQTPFLSFGGVGYSPQSGTVKPAAGNVQSLRITWPASGGVYANANSFSLNPANTPVIKLVASNASLSQTYVAYLIPTGSKSAASMTGIGSGGLVAAGCSGGVCTADVNGLPATPWTNASFGLIAVSALGGNSASNVTITPYADSSFTTGTTLVDGQAIITATARSQDVIKRLDATVPIGSSTWKPGFSVSTDTLCKNYLVDGKSPGGNAQPGPASGTLCPN